MSSLFFCKKSAVSILLALPFHSVFSHAATVPKAPSGTIQLSINSNPRVLNPLLATDSISHATEIYLWASLLVENKNTLRYEPYLAEKYSISKDRKTYSFELRKEAQWQDQSPITTQDIEFTFKTLMDPTTDSTQIRVAWTGIQLKVIDTHKFQFTLEEPRFDTERLFTTFFPIQKKQFETEKPFNQAKGILNPVSSGAYTLGTFSPSQRLELIRKPTWWGEKIPYFKDKFAFEKVLFRITPDPTLEYERLRKGDLSIMTFDLTAFDLFSGSVQGKDQAQFGKAAKDGKPFWAGVIKNKAPRGYFFTAWNLRNPIFESAKTRQALAHLIPYERIIQSLYFGHQTRATSPFGAFSPDSAPELRQAAKQIPYDPKKAQALLQEAGWTPKPGTPLLVLNKNGKTIPFQFTLNVNTNNPIRIRLAQILQEEFKKLGIQMQLRTLEWNHFLSEIEGRKYDAVMLGWIGSPINNPRRVWHTESQKGIGSNSMGYSNPAVDRLIEQSEKELNSKKRSKILQEINRLLYQDQPVAFMFEPDSMLLAADSKLQTPQWAMEYDANPSCELYHY